MGVATSSKSQLIFAIAICPSITKGNISNFAVERRYKALPQEKGELFFGGCINFMLNFKKFGIGWQCILQFVCLFDEDMEKLEADPDFLDPLIGIFLYFGDKIVFAFSVRWFHLFDYINITDNLQN